jgi:tRNA(Ile)-lysidine synthase
MLRTAPVAVARRAIRRAMEGVKGDLRSVDFSHIESVLDLAQSPLGHGAVQVPGLEILRSFNQIRIARRAGAPAAAYCYAIRPSGESLYFSLPKSSVCLQLIEKSETSRLSDYVYNIEMGCLDWGRLSGSLVLRNWKPGDRFQPNGSTGLRKMKSIFQAARIPVWEREQWPVLADGPRVVWTRRFGVAAAAAATDSTRVILRIQEMPTPAVPPRNSESGSGGPASNRL